MKYEEPEQEAPAAALFQLNEEVIIDAFAEFLDHFMEGRQPYRPNEVVITPSKADREQFILGSFFVTDDLEIDYSNINFYHPRFSSYWSCTVDLYDPKVLFTISWPITADFAC